MSLWDTMIGWISTEGPKYLYHEFPQNHISGAQYDPKPVASGSAYFRLWLAEMYLGRGMSWFTQWYPAVHSMVRLQFGSEQVEIPYVAGPPSLKSISETNLDKVIQLNHPITPLLPFNGGVVEVIAGLLALCGGTLTTPFLKVMSDFTNRLNVPQLSSVMTVASLVSNGLQEILTATNGGLHLGFHQSFQGEIGGGANTLHAGYLAVVLTDAQSSFADQLWVVKDRLQRGASAANSIPLKGTDYMLFRIDTYTERDDWEALTYLAEPRKKMLEALSESPKSLDRAKVALQQATTAARLSPDLTRADRTRVISALKKEYEDVAGAPAGAAGIAPPRLGDLVAQTMSVEHALDKGEPSWPEVFAVG